jgi:hypothetical protein
MCNWIFREAIPMCLLLRRLMLTIQINMNFLYFIQSSYTCATCFVLRAHEILIQKIMWRRWQICSKKGNFFFFQFSSTKVPRTWHWTKHFTTNAINCWSANQMIIPVPLQGQFQGFHNDSWTVSAAIFCLRHLFSVWTVNTFWQL